jgi:hypothetical protein
MGGHSECVETLFLRKVQRNFFAHELLDTCSCRCIRKFLSIGQNFGDDATRYLLGCCAVGGLRRNRTARLGNWQSRVSPRKQG